MSSKIEVSREKLESLIAKAYGEKLGNPDVELDELRALLAAPVVDPNAHLPHKVENLSDFLYRTGAPVIERQDVFGCIDAEVRKEVQGVYDAYATVNASQVVERQPVAFSWVVVSPDGKEFSELQSSEDAAKDLAHDMDGDLHPDHTGGRHEIKAVYTATPELAELQALSADALAVNKTLNQQMDALQATIAQLESKLNRAINLDFERRAEIERLKGGQGVAGRRERFQKWVLATKHPVLGFLDGHWLARGDDREGYANEYVQGLWVAFKEFTSQPAPTPRQEPVAYMRNEGTPNNLVKCTFMCPGAFGVYRQQPAPVSAVHPFADKVIRKLQRFQECTDDGQGADIGRHWFDLLTQLGLLNRVQRSPALWEITQQGEDCLDNVKELNQ
jgi:hypothetical protein